MYALLVGLLCWSGCQPPRFESPLDRPTEPGQRLWYLVVRAPSQDPQDLDSLVARPLLRALGQDPLCEVVAVISKPGAVVAFLRSDVAVSSVEAVERALAKIRLPDGSSRPAFGAAGPPGQAETPVFRWALRAEASSPAELQKKIERARAVAPFAMAPGPGAIVRLDNDSLATYLLFAGIDAAANCGRAAACLPGSQCEARETLSDGERALLGWPERSASPP